MRIYFELDGEDVNCEDNRTSGTAVLSERHRMLDEMQFSYALELCTFIEYSYSVQT